MPTAPAADVSRIPYRRSAASRESESEATTADPKTFNPYKRFMGKQGTSLFVPLALVRYPGLSFAAKLLYGRLCFHAGKDGKCFPSEAQLASELGMTDANGAIGESQIRTLRNYLAELKAAKLIEVESRYNSHGERITNAYRFLEHELFEPGYHRKEFSAGYRKKSSGKVRKEFSAKDRNGFSGVKEEPLGKEESSSKRTDYGKDGPCERSAQVQKGARPECASERTANLVQWEKPDATLKILSPANDDDKPRYASSLDRLTALMERDLRKQPEQKLVRDVTDELHRKSATLQAFCDDIEPRLKRLKPKPGGHPGFFLEHARQFAGVAPRPAPQPMLASELPTAAEPKDPIAWKAGLCSTCGGGGYLQVNPPVFCTECQMGRDLERMAKRAPPGKEAGDNALTTAATGT